jgi:hypothetical protein
MSIEPAALISMNMALSVRRKAGRVGFARDIIPPMDKR